PVTTISFRWACVGCMWLVLCGAVSRLHAAMAITRFEPMSGSTGTQVEIFGQGFAAATKVYFNGVEAQFSFDQATDSIKTKVPEGAVTGRIFVFAAKGFVASTEDFVIMERLPEVISFT